MSFTKKILLGLAVAAVALGATGSAMAAGTAPGTVISNQATVDYEDANGNALQALSNVVTTTVLQLGAVDVSPDNSGNADPSDTLYYAHTVTNQGNAPDTVDLTIASSQGWTVQFYVDADGSGTLTGGDTALGTTASTPLLAADGTYDILVEVVVPAGAADGAVDVTTVTGTSQFDGSVGTATDTTTITSPLLAVVKSVLPAGDQAPGTTLAYTVVVTNNGTADALNVVLTDPIPANTTYTGGTITLGGAGLTDANGDDAGEFDGSQIIVTIGTVSSGGGTTTITFDVVID
jgi:uncharacterized repeat protein (TIGR01451 family)